MRKKPPVLEILKRLPMMNCKQCGEPTCTAFACQVHAGAAPVSLCRPVFSGEYGHIREALVEICRGIGATE
jgi:ArsR family metal-binding transcriptional regulator